MANTRINKRQRMNMTPAQYEAFRAELKRLRKDSHLTCNALGELLDCSAVHISNVERGKRYPSKDLAKDIADVFGTTVDAMCISEGDRRAVELSNNGKDLLNKRISKGFKINEVAGFLGMSREAYMDMESGKCNTPDSIKEALDRLYKVEERVETIEVVKEIPTPSPISMWEIDKVLAHITDMDIDVSEQKALFKKLSDARTKMLEAELFG